MNEQLSCFLITNQFELPTAQNNKIIRNVLIYIMRFSVNYVLYFWCWLVQATHPEKGVIKCISSVLHRYLFYQIHNNG